MKYVLAACKALASSGATACNVVTSPAIASTLATPLVLRPILARMVDAFVQRDYAISAGISCMFLEGAVPVSCGRPRSRL